MCSSVRKKNNVVLYDKCMSKKVVCVSYVDIHGVRCSTLEDSVFEFVNERNSPMRLTPTSLSCVPLFVSLLQ